MKTRERIIATAVRLFNEVGSSAISTNHIAEAAGISPGNLYYHFRNKEEIIRAILEHMIERWAQIYTLPSAGPPTLADLRRLVVDNYQVLWEYRFFYRELVALLQRDPELRQRYQSIRQQGLANIKQLFAHFVAAGVLRDLPDPASSEALAEICWLISDFWLPFAETGGEAIGPAQMQRGVAAMMQILRPYLANPAD